MNFDQRKKDCLKKLQNNDKSKKGCIDEKILPLVELLNSLPDYYTTSSCSGRIMILSQPKKKQDCRWLYSTHGIAVSEKVMEALKDIPEETLWLKMEAPILHICARDETAADLLIKVANSAGFRHAGMISISPRLIIEICSTEKIEVPISEKNKLLVDEHYLGYLVASANKKLENSRKRLKKLEKNLTTSLQGP